MKRWIFFISLFLLLTIILWNASRPKTIPVEELKPLSGEISEAQLLPIPLISATASSPGNQWARLFEQENDSIWLFPKGRGPGECIEINFLQERMPYLSRLQIIPAQGDSLAELRQISVSVNGETTILQNNDFEFLLEQKVYALRICIESTKADVNRNFTESEQNIRIRYLFPEEQVGLRSIRFYDQNDRKYHPVPPRYINARAQPSSNLNPMTAYHAGQLFDGKTNSAWIEGEESKHSGGYLQIQLAESIEPDHLALWNGHQLSEMHYAERTRPARLLLTGPGLTPLTLICRDQMDDQLISLPKGTSIKDFSLEIDSVYIGSKHYEAAISELVFLQESQPLVLQTNWSRIIQEEVQSEIDQSPLNLYLNRPIKNQVGHTEGVSFTKKQLYFAADGSFYIHIERRQMASNHLTQLDVEGYWEIQTANAEMAVLRLFGESALTNFAADSTPVRENTPFNELIEVWPDRIEGGEKLGRFYRP